jgi:hypothetical protein
VQTFGLVSHGFRLHGLLLRAAAHGGASAHLDVGLTTTLSRPPKRPPGQR